MIRNKNKNLLGRILYWLKQKLKFSRGLNSNQLSDDIEGDVALSKEQSNILDNLLKLGNVEVSDVMVPRADIIAINQNTSFDETLELFLEESHSRMPIFSKDLDNIIGMIHVKDLLPFWAKPNDFSIKKIKRNVLFSSPSMFVADLLGQMRVTRTHLAIVVDEHGGTDGIVTIEDLVEEIVGEIEDEYDLDKNPKIIINQDGTFTADARTPITELESALGLSFSSKELFNEVDTVGGLIFSISGKIPRSGEIVSEINSGVNFKVLDADLRRINKVSVSRGKSVNVKNT